MSVESLGYTYIFITKTKQGSVTINKANLLSCDNMATNGVLNIVDRVVPRLNKAKVSLLDWLVGKRK